MAKDKIPPAPVMVLDQKSLFRRNESSTDVPTQGNLNGHNGQSGVDQAGPGALEEDEKKKRGFAASTQEPSVQSVSNQAAQPQPLLKQSSIWENLGKAVAVTGGVAYATLYATAAVGFFVATFPVGLAVVAVGAAVVGAAMLFNKIFKRSKQTVPAEAPRDVSMQERKEQEQQQRGYAQEQQRSGSVGSVAEQAAALRSSVGSYAPLRGSTHHSAPITPRDPTTPQSRS